MSWFLLSLLVHFSSSFFRLGKCLRHEHYLDYTYSYFSKHEVLRRRAARGSSSESECSWNDGKKKQLKLNFCSMYFVWNNEEIHFSLKKADTSFKQTWSWKLTIPFSLLFNLYFQHKRALRKRSAWVFDVTNRQNGIYNFQPYHLLVKYLLNSLAKGYVFELTYYKSQSGAICF